MSKSSLYQGVMVTAGLYTGHTGPILEFSDISNEIHVDVAGEGTKWFRPNALALDPNAEVFQLVTP